MGVMEAARAADRRRQAILLLGLLMVVIGLLGLFGVF